MNNPKPDPVVSSAAPLGSMPAERIGPYRLTRFLGEGGMGRVYLGHHSVLERFTALKFMPEELVRTPGWVDRFCSEARTLAKLDHPNIVRVYGAEADAKEQRCFLEIEYVDGGDLEDRVQKTSPGLDEVLTKRIVDEVLQGLAYAHGKGVVHRDLKPANILLRKDGTVKISDFGLATVIGEDYHRSLIQKSITLSQLKQQETVPGELPSMLSAVGGTLPYMSPQAKRGERPDVRDDVYAVGVMVYYLFTNKLPDYDTTPLRKLRPDLSPGWDEFFRKCITADRDKRFASAEETRAALLRIGKGGAVLKWAGIAVALAALGAAGWYGLSLKGSNDTPQIQSAAKLEQEIAFNTPRGPFGMDSGVPLSAVSTSGLPVSFQIISGLAHIEDGTLQFDGPGRVTVRAVQKGDHSYRSAEPVDRVFEASAGHSAPIAQTITLEEIGPKTTAEQVVPLVVGSTSKLPVSVSVVRGPAEITPQGLRLTGQAGEVVVRASQAGNGTYAPADAVERRFTVERYYPPEVLVQLPGDVVLKFVLVPAGRIRLGAPEGELGATPLNDSRREEFVLPTPFYIGATEVSQSQYRAIVGTNPSFHNRSRPDLHPVEQIRYQDLVRAGGFVDKFNAHLKATGQANWVAALPTDHEWEYACRAGTETALYDGSTLIHPNRDPGLDRLAVYGDFKAPAALGSKEPNAWKLYDMLGNVAEWTQEGSLRGGSYRDAASSVRAAARLRDARNLKDEMGRFGFRLVLKISPE